MINVLYCGNDRVFDGVLTSALSLLMRTKTQESFRFYIFTAKLIRIKPEYLPISDKNIEVLNGAVKKYGINNEVVKIDVTDLYERDFAKCPNEGCYCSPYTLLRLFADIALPKVKKLLYLDADVMFNKDVMLLYGIDISDYEYAAARDHYGKFLIRPDYINAGVLLFNMEKAAQSKLFEKARSLIRAKKLTFADQDALYHSTTKKLMLSQRYNDQKFLYKKTVVRHFSKRLFYLPYPHTDNVKQWDPRMKKVFGYTCFDDILDEYKAICGRKADELNP